MRLIITYKTGVRSEHKIIKKIWHLSHQIGDELMAKNPDIVMIQLTTQD